MVLIKLCLNYFPSPAQNADIEKVKPSIMMSKKHHFTFALKQNVPRTYARICLFAPLVLLTHCTVHNLSRILHSKSSDTFPVYS